MGEVSQPYLAAARPHPGVGMGSILAVAAEARTYRNLAYLLLALPLGLAYLRFAPVRVESMEEAAVAFLVAPAAILAAMHAANALAAASGRFAHLMLTSPDGSGTSVLPGEGAAR